MINLFFQESYSHSDDQTSPDLEIVKVSNSWIVSDIYIKNDNWSASDIDWIQNRSGTFQDPHIIENITITGTGSGIGLTIENSTDFFIVRNCSMRNFNIGIFLDRSGNGTIYNISSKSNQQYGISFNYCSNITVSGNEFSNNTSHDINIIQGSNMTIFNNSINSGLEDASFTHGIYIVGCSNITLNANNLSNCGIGIDPFNVLQASSCLIFHNNTVNGNPIYYYFNELNLKSSNFTTSGLPGQIILYNCNNSLITNLNIANSSIGLHLINSNNNSVLNCEFQNNRYSGIYIRSQDGMASNNNTIRNNVFFNNYYGTCLINEWEGESRNNLLLNNTYLFNEDVGIYILDDCFNTTLINNTITNSNIGIRLYYGFNTTIQGNTIVNNDVGMYLFGECNYSLIINNTIQSNDAYGIQAFFNTYYNLIYNNSFVDNGQNALDHGDTNQWDNGMYGNFWDDYQGEDEDGDGIGDTPYLIPGTANNYDNYPYWRNSSSETEDGGNNPDDLGIIILFFIIASTATGIIGTTFLIRRVFVNSNGKSIRPSRDIIKEFNRDSNLVDLFTHDNFNNPNSPLNNKNLIYIPKKVLKKIDKIGLDLQNKEDFLREIIGYDSNEREEFIETILRDLKRQKKGK